MKSKIYTVKNKDELIFTGKQIREFKKKVIEDYRKSELKVTMKPKRINVIKHKEGEEGCIIDCEEMIITGEKIGTTSDNKEFRIDKFKDGTFGFFINTNTQGNFVLKKSEIKKLKEFLK